MNIFKIVAVASLVANIILLVIIFRGCDQDQLSYTGQEIPKNQNLTDTFNFKKIFLEKNDSVYKVVFNKSFEDYPVQAYLLACTYYLLKKDEITKKDIEMISSEIRSIYGKSPEIIYAK